MSRAYTVYGIRNQVNKQAGGTEMLRAYALNSVSTYIDPLLCYNISNTLPIIMKNMARIL